MLIRRPQAAGASTTTAEWMPVEVGDGLRFLRQGKPAASLPPATPLPGVICRTEATSVPQLPEVLAGGFIAFWPPQCQQAPCPRASQSLPSITQTRLH